MTELWKYIIPAALGLVIGMLLFKSCSKPDVVVTEGRTDTIFVDRFDTVEVKSPARVVYRDKVKEIPVPVFTNTDECARELQDCNEEAWYLSEIEAEAVKRTAEGEFTLGFSVPRFLEQPSSAFTFKAHLFNQTQTITKTEYVQPDMWDRIGAGPYIGYGYPAGWNAGVSVQYQLFRTSDIWR